MLQKRENKYSFLDSVLDEKFQGAFVKYTLNGYESAAGAHESILNSSLVIYSMAHYEEFIWHFEEAYRTFSNSVGENFLGKPCETFTDKDYEEVEIIMAEQYYYYEHSIEQALLSTLEYFGMFFLVFDLSKSDDNENSCIDYSYLNVFNSPLQDVW